MIITHCILGTFSTCDHDYCSTHIYSKVIQLLNMFRSSNFQHTGISRHSYLSLSLTLYIRSSLTIFSMLLQFLQVATRCRLYVLLNMAFCNESKAVSSASSLVLPGSCSAFGASYHGVRETGQCVGHLSPGCDALLAVLLPGQGCRSEKHKTDRHTYSTSYTPGGSQLLILQARPPLIYI